jgi:hypothetical protein
MFTLFLVELARMDRLKGISEMKRGKFLGDGFLTALLAKFQAFLHRVLGHDVMGDEDVVGVQVCIRMYGVLNGGGSS